MPSMVQTHRVGSKNDIQVYGASPVPGAGVGYDMRDVCEAAVVVKGTALTQIAITASGSADMSNPVTVKDTGAVTSATDLLVEISGEELQRDWGSGYGLDANGDPLRYILATITGTVTAAAIVGNRVREIKDPRLVETFV